jgi:tRNA pseudouridine13 synthase
MKLKQQPEDFQVEELTNVVASGRGAFALYRLTKSGWTTLDALAAIRRRWNLEPQRISYGGLKDRHARTVQHLTIFHGPRRRLTHHQVTVEYLGQVARPFTSHDIRANRFLITLRDVDTTEKNQAGAVLDHVREQGAPNYFDDQRFGSVGADHEFAAKYLVLGNHEQALRLALAAPYAHDRAEQKVEKKILQSHWGDWPRCKADLPRGHARSLVDYLVHHPTDFKGAFARMRPELASLHLSAYQSHLWNRLLAAYLQQACRAEQLISLRLKLGDFPIYSGLDPEQFQALGRVSLPLSSARMRPPPNPEIQVMIGKVLEGEGFPLEQMKPRGLRKPFFSRGDRAALCIPNGLEYEFLADEKHAGRTKLVLGFNLPRGAYATLIVKRIQSVQFEAREAETDGPLLS